MARTIREEDLRLNVIVNGDPARKKILDLEKAVDASNASIRQMRKEQEMLAKQGQTDTARYRELSQAIKTETASVKQNNSELETLRKKMSLGSLTIAELTNKAKQLRTQLAHTAPGTEDWQRLNRELQETNSRLSELKGQSGKTGSAVNAISGGIAKAAGLIGVAIMGIRKAWQGLRGGVQTIADFEQANVNLATILGKNVEEISLLTDEALRLGAATKYTASQATGLQTELAKLGFAEREILSMGEPVLNFATAVGADLSEAAALSGAALRMFGLQANDTEDLLATFALSTNKSALSFSYLQTAISIVGPVAKTFGFSVKDTTALLGTLANAGFDASSAATATRNIILNLANANGKLAKALGEPVKTFPELMDGLKRLDAHGIDLATTLELTDKRSVAAFNSFLSGAESAVALREQLEDTGGVLQDIADKRMKTAEGALYSLKSAWERFVLSLRENTGWIKDALLAARDLLQLITPKEDHATAEELGRRTSDYVRGLWNIYEVDMAEGEEVREAALSKVSEAISEDEAKIEEQLRSAEAKLETTSGIRNKRRWKKEVERLREGLKVMTEARREYLDRVEWYFSEGEGGNPSPLGPSEPPEPPGPDKNKRSWSLQNDTAYLKAKASLIKEFNEGTIATQKEYDQKLYDLEVSTLTARIAARRESGADLLKLENELQEKILKHRQDEQKAKEDQAKKEKEALKLIEDELAAASGLDYNKKVLEETRRYEEEKLKFAGQKDALAAIERKHQRLMLQINIEGFNELNQIEKSEYDLRRQKAENHYTELIATKRKGSADEIALQREMRLALADIDREYLINQRKRLERYIAAGFAGEIEFSEKQLMEFRKKLAEVIKQINAVEESVKGENQPWHKGTGTGSLFGISEAQWGSLFKNLSEGKLRADDLANAFTALGGMAQEGFKIASQAIAMTNAKEQEELRVYQNSNAEKQKNLQKRLDAGLMTQAQYDAEIEKMQKEQEAKEAEVSLRQAEREKRMNIVQAIINTALSVTKTLAQFGLPYGPIAAGIVGAMGAAQIALMQATPVTGREGGGFFDADGRPVRVRRQQDGRSFPARLSPERRGFIDRPTVLVGENGTEYVIPAEALQNPSVAPFVDAIETARRSGRLRNLRLEAVQPRLAVAGRVAGGFFAEDADALAQGGSMKMPDGTRLSVANYQELLQLLRQMNVVFSKPIKAEVAMLGRNGIIEKAEEYNRAKRGGQLNG